MDGKERNIIMRFIPYDREAAVAYAERWALSRNPAYYDFDNLGGDCTNFVSQCLYAGCGVMNYTPETGWYYRSLNNRSPSWTGVAPFYRFLTANRSVGPYARAASRAEMMPGDVIQLGNGERFYHSLLVLEATPYQIYIASHSYDSLWRALDTYNYRQIRYLHILGARAWQ